jgi:hypothetical protein
MPINITGILFLFSLFPHLCFMDAMRMNKKGEKAKAFACWWIMLMLMLIGSG